MRRAVLPEYARVHDVGITTLSVTAETCLTESPVVSVAMRIQPAKQEVSARLAYWASSGVCEAALYQSAVRFSLLHIAARGLGRSGKAGADQREGDQRS